MRPWLALVAVACGWLTPLPTTNGLSIGITPAPWRGHITYMQALAKEFLSRGHSVTLISSRYRAFDGINAQITSHPNGSFHYVPMFINEGEEEYDRFIGRAVANATKTGDMMSAMPALSGMMLRRFSETRDSIAEALVRKGVDIYVGELPLGVLWEGMQKARDRGWKVQPLGIASMALSFLDPVVTPGGELGGRGHWFGKMIEQMILGTRSLGAFVDGWPTKTRQLCDLGGGEVGPDPDGKEGVVCAPDLPPMDYATHRLPVINQYFVGYDTAVPLGANIFTFGHLMEMEPPGQYLKIEPKRVLEWLDNSKGRFPGGVIVVTFGTSGVLFDYEIKAMFESFAAFPQIGFLWKTSQVNDIDFEIIGDIASITPPNVLLERWVDPTMQALFQHPSVVAVIQHGGLSSPMEAMAQGKAIITVPQVTDQKANAERLDALGVGCAIGIPFDGKALEICIGDVLKNRKAYEAKVAEVVALWSALKPVERAADLAEHIAVHGIEHLMHPNVKGLKFSEPPRLPLWRWLNLDLHLCSFIAGVVFCLVFVQCKRCLCCCCGGKRAVAVGKDKKKKH